MNPDSQNEKPSFPKKRSSNSYSDSPSPRKSNFGEGSNRNTDEGGGKSRFEEFARNKRGGKSSDTPDRDTSRSSDRPNKTDGDRPYRPKSEGYSDRPKRADGDRPYRPKSEGYSDRPKRADGDRPYRPKSEGYSDRPKRADGDRPYRPKSEGYSDRPKRAEGDKPYRSSTGRFASRPFPPSDSRDASSEDKPFLKRGDSTFKPVETKSGDRKRVKKVVLERYAEPLKKEKGKGRKRPEIIEGRDIRHDFRLNQYLAHCGICSRREADEKIREGLVKVNGEVITVLSTRVRMNQDVVEYDGHPILPEKLLYILLNKPKNTLTTLDDPEGRKTVWDIVVGAARGQRIYPVGRLDRNTTGLLLMTNDGDLADKLMHPSHEIRKMYHVRLNRPMEPADFELMSKGLELEDGMAKPDKLSYVADSDGSEIGIEVHIGRNRIVRRMFEHLGYEVKYLDRVTYAHLTKKDLPRGKWRYLDEKEVQFLKMV